MNFKQFKQQLSEKKSNTVYSKKISGVPVEISKEGSKFVVFIDGDKLDSYSTQKEAEKMASQFVKTYKGN